MRATIILSLLILAVVFAVQSCGNSASEHHLNPPRMPRRQPWLQRLILWWLTELVGYQPTDSEACTALLQAYLEAHSSFNSSAVALLDKDGAVIGWPYVYRMEDGYESLDLATPSYHIEEQNWFTMQLDANEGNRTAHTSLRATVRTG